VLDKIPFAPDMAALGKALHVPETGEYADALAHLVAGARAVARPKAVYGEAYVEERGEASVVVDGVEFASRVLTVNLEGVHRVFPYVATCGRELMQWADAIDDVLENYWADQVMVFALRAAIAAVNEAIAADFAPGRTSSMNPGSLEDWPLTQQHNLMELLGDPEKSIGVELTASCLMIPVKSISGIAFPAETGWENCRLCLQPDCPGRRAPHDPALRDAKYGRHD
jgi:hypothetical protein